MRRTCFLIVLFAVGVTLGYGGDHTIGAAAQVEYDGNIKEIRLEAFQFGFSPDPVVVKKGDVVKLEITSRDVPHGVYIKEYNINVPVKKGESVKVKFLADKEGEFDIRCSVFCGSGHSRMRGRLVVSK